MLNYSIQITFNINYTKMISKWAFLSGNPCRHQVGANVRRWANPVITMPNDQEAYNRFVRPDRTRAHLMLITHAETNLIDEVALSALNKFTSLRSAHPFAPPIDEISVLRGIQVPQTAVDKDNQLHFLNNFRKNMEISKANISGNITGPGMYINTGLPDSVVRAVCHVTSALIPNIVCVIDDRVEYASFWQATMTQLNVLCLGDTVDEATNKGIVVCAYGLAK